MMLKGQPISEGIAYGTVNFLSTEKNLNKNEKVDVDEISKFNKAIKLALEKLDNQINKTKSENEHRISDIFLSHKFMIKDPMIIEKTQKFILQGKKATEAYSLVISDTLKKFKKIDNEYMLGRIVDIIDISDIVKNELEQIEVLYKLDFDEPTILILDALKPSVIYELNNKNILGFITKEGYFNQHSGIIARTLKIPGIAYDKVNDLLINGDKIIINGFNGNIYKNPNPETIKKITEESR